MLDKLFLAMFCQTNYCVLDFLIENWSWTLYCSRTINRQLKPNWRHKCFTFSWCNVYSILMLQIEYYWFFRMETLWHVISPYLGLSCEVVTNKQFIKTHFYRCSYTLANRRKKTSMILENDQHGSSISKYVLSIHKWIDKQHKTFKWPPPPPNPPPHPPRNS